MSTIANMSLSEIMNMCYHRERSMSELLGLPNNWYFSRHFGTYEFKNKNKLIIVQSNNINIDYIFDETTAAIGEDWLWDSGEYYFVRESDAVWFRLRWE